MKVTNHTSIWGRRDFLKIGSLGPLGLTLGQALRAKSANDISCILLWQSGGCAHQDTFDMKPEAPIEYRGEFKPIPTNVPGIHVCPPVHGGDVLVAFHADEPSEAVPLGEPFGHAFAALPLITAYRDTWMAGTGQGMMTWEMRDGTQARSLRHAGATGCGEMGRRHRERGAGEGVERS